MRARGRFRWSLVLLLLSVPPVLAEEVQALRSHLADYNSELRGPDGRVNTAAMVNRLKELGVTTYYWLIWHARTDWDDLKAFLPQAAQAQIEVWVYLVPPSESPPKYGTHYCEPFRLDYVRWGEEIARLSVEHPNLTAWVIDDFYANRGFFTPDYLRAMREKARAINPQLAFLPLMYYREIRPQFVSDYRGVIDGVVVAYFQDREEIERTWAILNDATLPPARELGHPWDTPSRAGDHVTVTQTACVRPGEKAVVRFSQRDDFDGPTAGYHVKQLLVDDTVVWEEDVAGGTQGWGKAAVDVTAQVRGKTEVTLAFRLLDRKGVSNFGVQWSLRDLSGEHLQLSADLGELPKWKASSQGAFTTGFGVRPPIGQRRFHVPLISMTAASPREFALRHGDPATPARIAEQLRLSLEAWREGKCAGVVTYCLDKQPGSATFPLVQSLFHQFAAPAPGRH